MRVADVDGHNDDVMFEDVHLLGPPPDARILVPRVHQLRVEKAVQHERHWYGPGRDDTRECQLF